MKLWKKNKLLFAAEDDAGGKRGVDAFGTFYD